MKFFICFVLLVSILSISSCNTEEPYALKKINQETIIYNNINTIHDYEEVVDVLEQNIEMYSFCEKFNITQYKDAENINYTVIRTTKGLFMVLFNSDGQYGTIQEISFSPLVNKERLYTLKAGMTLAEVRTVDPAGQYPFLYHSWSDYPRISHHFFESGDYFCIEYEADVIVSIIHLTI